MRHLATRINEQQKNDEVAVMGCSEELGGTAELKSEIIEQTGNTHKLLKLEVSHILKERSKINTHDCFKSQKKLAKIEVPV